MILVLVVFGGEYVDEVIGVVVVDGKVILKVQLLIKLFFKYQYIFDFCVIVFVERVVVVLVFLKVRIKVKKII